MKMTNKEKVVKQMRLTKRKTFLTLLLSNSLILLLVLTTSLFTFIGVTELYKDEIKKHYEIEAQMDKQVIDSALKNIDEILYKLSLDSTISQISKYAKPLSNTQYLTAAQWYDEFEFLEYNYMIEDLYLVFPQTDLVVRKAGCNTLEEYYSIYLREKVESYEAFEKMVKTGSKNEIIASHNGKDIFFINSILTKNSMHNSAVVVIDFNEKLLFPHQNGDSKFQFSIYEKAQNSINSIIGIADEKFDVKKALSKGVYKNGNKEYFTIATDSEQRQWKYVYLVDISALSDRMAGMNIFLTFGIGLTIVFGVILLFFLTKRQYAPIKEIVSRISKNFGEDSSYKNDYEYIGSVVGKFSEEFKPESVMKREKDVKELGLLKLLRGEVNNDATQKIVESTLLKKHYMVAIFVVEDAGKLFFEETKSNDNESLARFIIRNVLGEIIGEQFSVEMCEAENIIFIIGSDDESRQDEFYNLLCDGQSIIEEKFNLKFSSMLSQFHIGIEGISKCYSEARDCFSYRIFSNSGIVRYSEIDGFDFKLGYSYTTEQEKSLSNYLKTFNNEAAKSLIDEMLDFDTNGERRSPISFRCMIYDIIGTVVKNIYDMGVDGEEFLKQINIFERVEKCNTTPKIRELLSQIIDDCCSFISSKNEKAGKKITEHIKAFVALNYGDPNLSVGMIAQKFDMNANYLSTLFKKETESVLSAYITAVRIEKAKEILKNEHLKLEKVAHMCGYESIRTFSRVFTNQVGITPGKYRENIRL